MTEKLYTFSEMLTEGIIVKNNDTESRHKVSRMQIPMIQRPYAQGRKSQQSIRNKFLNDIFNALCDPKKEKYELNFLYGTFVNEDELGGTFELLDGQQRLTTLFLLHWYFAIQEKIKDADFVFPAYLHKFVYQTRTTSTDFLNKLVDSQIVIDGIPSKSIRKASWYSKSFDKDTTIDSMLRMLDAISIKYQEVSGWLEYGSLEKLKFYVLELNGFGLSEELFIKMNARGLQLTPFENFKADLIGYMMKQPEYSHFVRMTLSKFDRKVPYWQNYSSLIDCKWSDLFWDKPSGTEDSGSKQCDIRFFRFLQRYFANKAIICFDRKKGERIRENTLYNFFSKNVDVERHSGFNNYAQFILQVANSEYSCDVLNSLETVLNTLSNREHGRAILSLLTAPWETSRTWEPWGTEGNGLNDVGQRQMIILSAFTEYIEKVGYIENFDMKPFKRWMRFVHCMVQGTDINGEDAQITLTRQLNDILNHKEEGSDEFITIKNPYHSIIAYNNRNQIENRYLQAEATKAQQILDDEAWEIVFEQAEKDEFMQGFITIYYQSGMSIDTYSRRTSNVKAIFDKDGVKKPYSDSCLLIRAVLNRNNDWTAFKKNGWPLHFTNKSSDRYLRAQTIWNKREEVKDMFRHLLDLSTEEERLSYLKTICCEENEPILPEGIWTDDAKQRLIQAFHRLVKNEGITPFTWFQNNGYTTIATYLYNSGHIIFWVGYVNCILLSGNRHEYIPAIVSETKDILNFQFADFRQKDGFDKYGTFTGENVTLYSNSTLEEGRRIKIHFGVEGSISIYSTHEETAKRVHNMYKKVFDVEVITKRDGKSILDENGNLPMHGDNKDSYYLVCYIQDAEQYEVKQLIEFVVLSGEKVLEELSE